MFCSFLGGFADDSLYVFFHNSSVADATIEWPRLPFTESSTVDAPCENRQMWKLIRSP